MDFHTVKQGNGERIEWNGKGFNFCLEKRIPKAHVDYLRSLGVAVKHLRDWERLIAMRYEEYATGANKAPGNISSFGNRVPFHKG